MNKKIESWNANDIQKHLEEACDRNDACQPAVAQDYVNLLKMIYTLKREVEALRSHLDIK